jgi:2-keto-3-deoxy-L-rhamnonate aldolase RhmA
MKRSPEYGTWCLIPSPMVVNIIAKAGADFVLLDREHGSTSIANLSQMIMAAQAERCKVFCRSSKIEEVEILRILDCGPDGIIVPHVNTKADAELFVKYTSYPPNGCRGFSPYTRSGSYHYDEKYMQRENGRIQRGIIIESRKGVSNLASILTSDIDIVYIGVYDLSSDMGIPGDITNPLLLAEVQKCFDLINGAGKIAGGMFHDETGHTRLLEGGASFLVYKVDTGVLYDGFSSIKQYKKEI